MRTPKRRRPRVRKLMDPPPGTDLERIASQVSYVGSPEHKDRPSFAGQPRPRADASICDPGLAMTQDQLTEHLQTAVRNGRIGAPWEGEFPRYIWCRIGEAVYEARLVNRGNGAYKGYPLEPEERPQGIQ